MHVTSVPFPELPDAIAQWDIGIAPRAPGVPAPASGRRR